MIVLDTHAWIWFVDQPDILGRNALAAIETARKSKEIFISSISAWEVYMLSIRGRLSFTVEPEIWIKRCERFDFFRFIAVDNEIARIATSLPGEFHTDPADRMIVATGRYLGAPVITRDAKIHAYPHVEAIW